MRIEQHKHGAITVLRPRGAVSCESDAQVLRKEGFETLGRTLGRFVMDVSDMPFVDSYGLETLVDLTSELSVGGRNLCLCGTGEALREVLSVTETLPLFTLHEDVQSAVRSFL